MQKAAKTRAKAGNSGKITGPEQKIAVGRKGERRKPGAAKQRDHHCRTPQMPDYWVSQAHPIYAWVRTRHAKSPARFRPGHYTTLSDSTLCTIYVTKSTFVETWVT